MSLVSGIAIYFVIWWIALFAILPIGLRTQAEEGNITPGTVASAPAKARIWLAFIRTTVLATLIFISYYYITQILEFGLDDIPHFYPELR